MEGLAYMFRVLVSLHMFSVLWSPGCLQESGNPGGWAEHPRGGCGSLTGYQEGELQGGTHSGLSFSPQRPTTTNISSSSSSQVSLL